MSNFVPQPQLNEGLQNIREALEALSPDLSSEIGHSTSDNETSTTTTDTLSQLQGILKNLNAVGGIGLDLDELSRYNDYFRYDAWQNMFDGQGLDQLNNYFKYLEIDSQQISGITQDLANWASNHKGLIDNVGKAATVLEIGSYIHDVFASDDPIAELAEVGVKVAADMAIPALATIGLGAIGLAGAPLVIGVGAVAIVGSVLLDKDIEALGEYVGQKLESIEAIDNLSNWLDDKGDAFEEAIGDVANEAGEAISDFIDNPGEAIDGIIDQIGDSNLVNSATGILKSLF